MVKSHQNRHFVILVILKKCLLCLKQDEQNCACYKTPKQIIVVLKLSPRDWKYPQNLKSSQNLHYQAEHVP